VAGIEKPLESCAVCHGENSLAAVDEAHAITGRAAVSNVVFQAAGPDLVVTYNLKIDGQNVTDFVQLRSDYRYTAGATVDAGANAPTGGAGGNYSITIPNGVASAGAASRYFFRVSNATTPGAVAAVVSGDYPAAAFVDAVSDESCNNCHGPTGIAAHVSFGYPGMTASQCVVCHKATSGLPFLSFEDSWVGLVHGIHASHIMPSGSYQYGSEEFEVTYPTYMTNCSVCHDDSTILTSAVNTMPVTGAGCFSCHESMEAWDFTVTGTTFHEAYDETTNCQTCHAPAGIAAATVADFHNGLETERIGIIWNGEDQSVSEGAKFTWQITSIVDNGTTLAISWAATYNGNPINPCNTTVGPSAPVIFPYGPNTADEGTTSMLRSYVQGDDYVLGQSTSAPGQALAVNLSTANTVCAGNVATTTIPVNANIPAGTRGVVALQGKWQVPVPAGFASSRHAAAWPYSTMFVRVPTPTEEWVVGASGIVPKVDQRREIADTAACLKCHVGSLYQHGNTRVDNVQMCVICHNPASSEKNVRVGMGVDASESYDGKAGETYELKTMLHAIHSAGIPGQKPIVIYRNRGIYAWAPDVSLLRNWPGSGSQIVFGSNNVTTNHTFHVPTYPRALNDCVGCHVADFDTMVDQTQGVATTIDAGEAPWNNQLDDKLQGANTAACTSCHQDAPSVGHANQNGWVPSVFPNGRQTIIDAAD